VASPSRAQTSANDKRQAPRAPRSKLDPAIFVDFVTQASRPLILVGPASCTKRGRELRSMLEAATGVPVIGMESPRGIADPGLGAFPEVLAQADAILLLGKRLDFTLKFGKAPAIAEACGFMQVDAQQDEIARTKRALAKRVKHAAVISPTYPPPTTVIVLIAQSTLGGGGLCEVWGRFEAGRKIVRVGLRVAKLAPVFTTQRLERRNRRQITPIQTLGL